MHGNIRSGLVRLRTATGRRFFGTRVKEREPSGFMTAGEFPDELNDCRLLKEDSAPYS